MAQTTQITIDNQTFPSFRSKLNESLSALNTLNSGTSRPSSAAAGTIWLDTTNATNPTLKFYDGADDISLATIDYSANTVNWLDSSVSLTSPVAVSGNSTAGAEIRLPEDTDNGSNYVALKAADSIASNVTFTLPSADGTADQILKTDGSGNLSFIDVSGGTDWQSSIVTGTTLSAVAGNGYWINTTSNTCTITLPASASVGDTIEFVDYARTWGTNKIIIDSNSLNYQGDPDTSTVEYNTNGQSIRIVYSGATQGWIPTVDDDVTDAPIIPPYDVDFLVIAGGGGGGGGGDAGGGGGAGGYRASYNSETSGGGGSSETALTLTSGTTYTITVGGGGAGATDPNSNGSNGQNSSISGSGITTITSSGGGGGGGYGAGSAGGSDGGCGGGDGSDNNAAGGGSGTANQGYDGGTSSSSAGSGGGGAGAAGANTSSSDGGNGGNGVASTITGSSITRAGGGGGGANNGTSGGTGGTGGGGDGGDNASDAPVAGTANTGGGGGGSGDASGQTSPAGAAGGSGVVILRMATANYSGTTTGSPTVSTDGTDTILIYTGSGSYTA